MSSSSKAKSGKRRGNASEGIDGVVTANDAAPPGRRRVKVDMTTSGSSLPYNNTPSRNMFGDNIAISGGQFTQAETVISVSNSRADPFELLQRRVAPSAFHNSAQRVDPPRCHPDTRVAILDSIYDWIIHSEYRREWLLWLNGAAGAGKSAIIQSISERCVLATMAIASFFFFRQDTTRNNMAPLIATLAYQLIQAVPETSNDILLTIERNPLIFDQSLESQLQQLLVEPLLRLPKHLKHLFVVLIDGLDECNDRNHQASLVKLFGTISLGRNSPIIFLVASRREPQIEAAFVDRQVCNLLRILPLDNSDIEQSSADIRHFLTDKFKDIKATHLRRHLLPSNWPKKVAIEEIVTTSSGQFIYASVVINYVSSPRAHPAQQLDIVRGIRLRDPSSQSPFAHLDALYQYIFSQVEGLDKVFDILAYILITKNSYVTSIEGVFLLGAGELEVCFADLTAVIKCEPHTVSVPHIKFLHASLPDFLRDKTRSDRYHIDVEEYTPKLLHMFLNRVPPILELLSQAHDSYMIPGQEFSRLCAIQELLASGVKVSGQLQQSFMAFNVEFYKVNFIHATFYVGRVIAILTHLKQLNFDDQGQAYHHVLDMFAVRFAKHWSLLDEDAEEKVKEFPDLLARISQIRQQ